MAHPAKATFCAPRPQQALIIIGGGDGGMAEKLLKRNTMQRVVLAELDEAVIRPARAPQAIANGVWSDPRLQLQIGDGMPMSIRPASALTSVMDLTDPETRPPVRSTAPQPAAHAACAQSRRCAGVLHLGSPIFPPRAGAQPDRHAAPDPLPRWPAMACTCRCTPLTGAWRCARLRCSRPAWAPRSSPSAWPSAVWAICSCYNADIHGALFALPNYYRQLVQA